MIEYETYTHTDSDGDRLVVNSYDHGITVCVVAEDFTTLVVEVMDDEVPNLIRALIEDRASKLAKETNDVQP